MRPFGYFSGEGKVTRGTGPEAPKNHSTVWLWYTSPSKFFQEKVFPSSTT